MTIRNNKLPQFLLIQELEAGPFIKPASFEGIFISPFRKGTHRKLLYLTSYKITDEAKPKNI